MIGNWMVYLLLLSLALAATAWLVELVLLKWRGPTRAAWMSALSGLFIVPAVAALAAVPRSETALGSVESATTTAAAPVTAASQAVTYTPSPLEGSPTAGFDVAMLDRPLLFAWVLASLGVGVFLVLSRISLARRHREWRMHRVEGTFVWMSRDVGPAVVGFAPPEIVVPEWFVTLPEDDRALLLRHEQEHLKARDPLLWLFALITLMAFPWNPVVWWKVRRLRTAIEVDCDARVLDQGQQTERYGALLLNMAARPTRSPLAGAAFSPRSTQLERRVRAMTTFRGKGWKGIATAGLLGSVLLLTASRVPPPEAPWPSLTNGAQSSFPAGALDADPVLLNSADIAAAIAAVRPTPEEEALGDPVLGLAIDRRGAVTHLLVAQSSGSARIDNAAIEVMKSARYSPGVFRGSAVQVYLLLPVHFES